MIFVEYMLKRPVSLSARAAIQNCHELRKIGIFKCQLMHVKIWLERSNFPVVADADQIRRITIFRKNGYRESGFLEPLFSNRLS